jgi:hypothetical protein
MEETSPLPAAAAAHVVSPPDSPVAPPGVLVSHGILVRMQDALVEMREDIKKVSGPKRVRPNALSHGVGKKRARVRKKYTQELNEACLIVAKKSKSGGAAWIQNQKADDGKPRWPTLAGGDKVRNLNLVTKGIRSELAANDGEMPETGEKDCPHEALTKSEIAQLSEFVVQMNYKDIPVNRTACRKEIIKMLNHRAELVAKGEPGGTPLPHSTLTDASRG